MGVEGFGVLGGHFGGICGDMEGKGGWGGVWGGGLGSAVGDGGGRGLGGLGIRVSGWARTSPRTKDHAEAMQGCGRSLSFRVV